MTSGRAGLQVSYGSRFEQRLRGLPEARRLSSLRVIEALARHQPTPGMRVKPILPGKFYSEARISSGDRLIFRIADGVLYLIDLVTHDEIAQCSVCATPPKPAICLLAALAPAQTAARRCTVSG